MGGMIRKIVSGGQTGVDRAALNVAIYLEIEHGGWCPLGRRAEDGVIPEIYQLKESASRNYRVRTRLNVVDSDATLILFWNTMTGGTALTAQIARQLRRPLLTLDLAADERFDELLNEWENWVVQHNVRVLNVAGPRAGEDRSVERAAQNFLINGLNRLQETSIRE